MKRIQIAKYSYILTSAAIILIGCFFLIRPETSLVTLSRAVGAVVLVSGLAKLFGYFSNDAHQIAFQFDLALGALTALFSIVILLSPEQFAKYLTMLVSIFVVTNALFTVQNAVEAKRFGIRKWWVLLDRRCGCLPCRACRAAQAVGDQSFPDALCRHRIDS